MKDDPYDNPSRNAGVLRNLVYNFQLIHATSWLASVTLDEAIDQWRLVHKDDKVKPKRRQEPLRTG